jgi:putative membrane protein
VSRDGGDRVAADPGHEPDLRFTLATDRTFLAWIRTSLALTVSGLGVNEFVADSLGQILIVIALVALGASFAIVGHRRWVLSQKAMRIGSPLPAMGYTVWVASVGLVMIGILAVFVIS